MTIPITISLIIIGFVIFAVLSIVAVWRCRQFVRNRNTSQSDNNFHRNEPIPADVEDVQPCDPTEQCENLCKPVQEVTKAVQEETKAVQEEGNPNDGQYKDAYHNGANSILPEYAQLLKSNTRLQCTI